ncbi:MAG: HDIG domain-containing protein [Stanieria sp.]
MKSLSLLTEQLEAWRQKHQNRCNFNFWWRAKAGKKQLQIVSPQQLSQQRTIRRKHRQRNALIILVVSLISLTSVVGYRFYNQPQLAVGTIAPVKIEAPHDGQFEDQKTTAEKRKEVQTGIVPILKNNQIVTEQIKLNLAKYLEYIEQIRQLSAPFPFLDQKIISAESQQYLRSTSEAELNTILKSVENKQALEKLLELKPQLAKIATELQSYAHNHSQAEFETLAAKITLARYRYAQAWKKLEAKQINQFNEQEINAVINLNNSVWATTKTSIMQAAERILTQGIPPGMPSNLLEEAVSIQLSPEIPPQTAHLASNLLLSVLQPNLEHDREATKTMAEKAALAIEPVVVEIKQGEVIVDRGETITQADFVLLDGFGLSRRTTNWTGLKISAILVTTSVFTFLLIQQRIHRSLRQRDYVLLCLLSLSSPIMVILNVPYNNLPAIGLLVSSFYSPALAICQISLLTGLLTFSSTTISWEYLLASTAGGLLAAAIAGKLRSREAMARLGIIVGLTQGAVYLFTNLIVSATPTTIWSVVLPGAIFYGLTGVAWSVVALGISPYLERLFDVVTPIRLAELSNPNLPLLKRLATEAPGTFQHTMFVASLAEAAARELNCNVELIRAGTLYHDIGKMHDPLGFIENQMGGPNKHDEIDDPWLSAEIIKKHVTEGLVMARKHGLPKAIRDFIPEHQGTLLISYFYYQAKQIADRQGTIVYESDFRYDGPVPQSREAGITMLADGCEAALRSLKDVTPEQALSMVKKIFKARWQDQQLVDSGLKYEELPVIAEVFIRVWQQFNHKRIVYPKGALDARPSNGK